MVEGVRGGVLKDILHVENVLLRKCQGREGKKTQPCSVRAHMYLEIKSKSFISLTKEMEPQRGYTPKAIQPGSGLRFSYGSDRCLGQGSQPALCWGGELRAQPPRAKLQRVQWPGTEGSLPRR